MRGVTRSAASPGRPARPLPQQRTCQGSPGERSLDHQFHSSGDCSATAALPRWDDLHVHGDSRALPGEIGVRARKQRVRPRAVPRSKADEAHRCGRRDGHETFYSSIARPTLRRCSRNPNRGFVARRATYSSNRDCSRKLVPQRISRFKSCLPDQFRAARLLGSPDGSRPLILGDSGLGDTVPRCLRRAPRVRSPQTVISEAPAARAGRIGRASQRDRTAELWFSGPRADHAQGRLRPAVAASR